jgi:hypothetical protein
MGQYTLEQLNALPTLHSGHFDNLKIETDARRVWLSRCGVDDGLPYDNGVTVEHLRGGRWTIVQEYEAK